MDTQTSTPIGPLYHGTDAASARPILRDGFCRGTSCNYTGTGICLSESLSVAYEYGAYETGGCVLEAWLTPSALWTDRIDCDSGVPTPGDAWDRFFKRTRNDAVCTFGGNVWIVWNPAVLVSIRRLSHREAIRRLCQEFDDDGPNCGYNGCVSEYASIWWGQQAQDLRLMRLPEYVQALRQRLQRFVGRSQSGRAGTNVAASAPGDQ